MALLSEAREPRDWSSSERGDDDEYYAPEVAEMKGEGWKECGPLECFDGTEGWGQEVAGVCTFS